MTNLVSGKWLKENIDKKNLIVIDCRFNLMDKEYGKRSYDDSHIKGAVRVDIETELSAKVREHGGRHPLPSAEELKNTFENLGVSNDSIVVAYDEGDLAGPCRLWWILKYLGHDKVFVLNGGMNSFIEAGGEISNEVPQVVKSTFDISVNDDMRVDMEYVRERLYNKNVAIIDSRENPRYRGEFEPVDKKAGHIPSALNYFWMDILNQDNNKIFMKTEEELKELFKELNNYDEVIVYCGSGITACPNSLALNEVNINHKVYAGSFSDWISYEENKVETV